MITSLWNKIELYCGEHGDDRPPMELELRKGLVYYVCSGNINDSISDKSRHCGKMISMKEFEKFLEKVTALLDEADLNNEIINLKHQVFHIGQIQYRVFDHDNDKIKVVVNFLS